MRRPRRHARAVDHVDAPAQAPAATGCQAMPTKGLLGFINPRQMCSALLGPLCTLGSAAR